MSEEAARERAGSRKWYILSGLSGLVLGVVLTAVVVMTTMPGMMIVTRPSPLGFEETVTRLESSIEEQGWVHSGTRNMNKSLSKHGTEFEPRVRLVALCHPDYAESVLSTDRYVSCLMPCKIAVWEGDDGGVYLSKMNTGLMGKMFGGNIARVMGGSVAKDEHEILARVLE